MFKKKLYEIKKSIEANKSTDLFGLVNARLNKTFNLYVDELQVNYDKLLRHRDIHVLKRIARGNE